MSKYYKVEDVIRKRAEDLADTSYWEYGNPKNVDDWIEVAEMEFKDLPTIEVMEYPQVEGITPTLVTTEVSEEEKKVNLSYVEWLEQVFAEYQPDWICYELVTEDSWCYDRCKSNWDKECLMRYYNKHFSEVTE